MKYCGGVIAFNLSVDFEMGWGDLERLAVDDVFYRRVVEGNGHVAEVIQLLGRLGMQSTWGVVGACCYADIEELRQSAPRSFHAVDSRIRRARGAPSRLFTGAILPRHHRKRLHVRRTSSLRATGFYTLWRQRIPRRHCRRMWLQA